VTEAAHIKAVRRTREACKKHGITAGMHASSGRWAKQHAEAGFGMVTVASDASLLSEAARRETMAARGESAESRSG
jgi:4-hydroxy-2-oxoheptanedioate aldolase